MSKIIPDEHTPIAFKLVNNKDEIFKHKPNPQYSTNIDYPKFSLGFHHFIHQTKDKMVITKEFRGRKKIYYVMSRFERYVDDYDKDLNNVSKKFFNLNKKPNILSRAFFKLWELLFMFDLIPTNGKNFISAHLAEGPGSFIQATMFFRDLYAKKGLSKNDKFYAITLHSEDINKHVPPLEKDFVNFYKKEKPLRFIQHTTYPKKIARQHAGKDNGDITNPKTHKLFGGNFKNKKAHFITADGGFDWKNENVQEQEAFKLIFSQIVMAIKIQAKGGHFVCKFFETFSKTSIKFISILKSFYKNVYIVKPLTSRQSNSEKYLICMNFSGENSSKIKMLNTILIQTFKNNKLNLVDIFPDFNTSEQFDQIITKSNTIIANRQFMSINQIVKFIKSKNYRGETYQNKRNEQIDATKFWIDRFYIDSKSFTKHKKSVEEQTEILLKSNEKLI